MRRGAVRVWLIATSWLCLWSISGARAQTPDSAEYRATIRAALEQYTSGAFAEARPLFERAHHLQPSARTLRGLGLTSFELGEYPRAIDELEAARIDPRNPLSPDMRRELEAVL
ncbi:MAG TPA: hypothetical protein VJR89_44005, partial [Polyangiales bacterium]|nr:hypothetical protein [Polyangiales bacterium]